MRVAALAFVFGCFVLSSCVTWAQSEFSAEIVDLEKPGAPVLAKIYFGTDRRRIEFQPPSGQDAIIAPLTQPVDQKNSTELHISGPGRVILLNLASKTATLLSLKDKTYSGAALGKLKPSELYGLYAVVYAKNVDDACIEWMQMPGAQGESCRKLGSETVNGRDAVKYELSCYGEACQLWIDRYVHVLTKRQSKWTSTELRNIQVGPQLLTIFEVPSDYASINLFGIIRHHEPQ